MVTITAEVRFNHPSREPATLADVQRTLIGTHEEVDADNAIFNVQVPAIWYDHLERDGELDVVIGALWVHAEMP